MKVSLSDIKIRSNYQPGDIGTLTRMHGVNYDFGIDFEAYVAITLSNFYLDLDNEKERFWFAEFDNEIVGHIALKNTDDWAQLRYFLIDKDFRGIGLGKKLMSLFFDFMKSAGYSKSFLLTEKGLKTAAHIYEKYGYRYVSHNYTDYGLEERRYELILPASS